MKASCASVRVSGRRSSISEGTKFTSAKRQSSLPSSVSPTDREYWAVAMVLHLPCIGTEIGAACPSACFTNRQLATIYRSAVFSFRSLLEIEDELGDLDRFGPTLRRLRWCWKIVGRYPNHNLLHDTLETLATIQRIYRTKHPLKPPASRAKMALPLPRSRR